MSYKARDPEPWLTVKKAIEVFGKYPQVITMKSDDEINSEVPRSETKEIIQDFAPKIRMQGLTLWAERFGLIRSWFSNSLDVKLKKLSMRIGGEDKGIDSWGGPYTRVMKNKDDSWRCVQYIYIYTRQKGVISVFWNVIAPFFVGLWCWLVLMVLSNEVSLFYYQDILSGEEMIGMFIALIALFLPWYFLGVHSIGPHFFDRIDGKSFRLRSTTFLIIPFALTFFIFDNTLVIYDLPLIPLIIMSYSGFMLIISILEYKHRIPSAHRMDYMPVFVWIKRKRNARLSHKSESWEPKYLTYDFSHYKARTIKIPENDSNQQKDQNKESDNSILEKVPLMMTEPWHSLELDERKHEKFKEECTGCYGCTCWMSIGLIVFGLFTTLPIDISLKVLCFNIIPIIICMVGDFFCIEKCDLIDNVEDYTDGEAYLDEKKLFVLWNLEEAARLKIVTKLLDPFRFFDPKLDMMFDSFDVEIRDILSRL